MVGPSPGTDVSGAGGATSDPAQRVACRIGGQAKLLATGYCHQLGGQVIR